MKILIFVLALFSTQTFAGVGAEVTDIRDPMVPCDCSQPAHLGRICITTTKWAHDDMPRVTDEYLSRFVADIENDDTFVMTSKAYYHVCNFGPTPNVYTDPERNKEYEGQKFFDMPTVMDYVPYMRVALINIVNGKEVLGTLSEDMAGTTELENAFYYRQTPYEFYRVENPGTVVVKAPLYKFLTDTQIRMILDEGAERYRSVKAVLTARTQSGKAASFGIYTIRIRFFRKPGTVLKHRWDTKAIGIEMMKESVK